MFLLGTSFLQKRISFCMEEDLFALLSHGPCHLQLLHRMYCGFPNKIPASPLHVLYRQPYIMNVLVTTHVMRKFNLFWLLFFRKQRGKGRMIPLCIHTYSHVFLCIALLLFLKVSHSVLSVLCCFFIGVYRISKEKLHPDMNHDQLLFLPKGRHQASQRLHTTKCE